jgi:hypothetical protein
METEKQLWLADVFVSITDPRQAAKVEHDLVELLVVAVSAVLVGADTFVEIELWVPRAGKPTPVSAPIDLLNRTRIPRAV